MDIDWARQRLEHYLKLLRAHDEGMQNDIDFDLGWFGRDLQDQIAQAAPTVQRIINSLYPAMAGPHLPVPPSTGWQDTGRSIVSQAIGMLVDQEDVERHLAPAAPSLTADRFHHWVWAAAAPFWDAGQRAAAVDYGAKSLTAFIQQKSGCALADRELAADVFSPRAHESRVRLWLPGDRDGDTWKSRQDGLHLLAMGAFAGIRNVVAHSVEPGWSEQEALEYLSVLSTVARWVDETVRVEPAPEAAATSG